MTSDIYCAVFPGIAIIIMIRRVSKAVLHQTNSPTLRLHAHLQPRVRPSLRLGHTTFQVSENGNAFALSGSKRDPSVVVTPTRHTMRCSRVRRLSRTVQHKSARRSVGTRRRRRRGRRFLDRTQVTRSACIDKWGRGQLWRAQIGAGQRRWRRESDFERVKHPLRNDDDTATTSSFHPTAPAAHAYCRRRHHPRHRPPPSSPQPSPPPPLRPALAATVSPPSPPPPKPPPSPRRRFHRLLSSVNSRRGSHVRIM